MVHAKNVATVAVIVALSLAVGACGKKRTVNPAPKQNAETKAPAQQQPALMQPTINTATQLEGRWRTACLADLKVIRTAEFKGNLLTLTEEKFSDAACTGPGQPTVFQSHFQHPLGMTDADSEFQYLVTYTDGVYQDLVSEVRVTDNTKLEWSDEAEGRIYNKQ